MVYKTQGEKFEIKDELLREFEEILGRPYPQTKFELMYYQATKIHEKEKYNHQIIEKEINNLLEEYNQMGKEIPGIAERIAKGDIVHC